MKYLKTFESKTIDIILDKILKSGIKSLTPSESRFLKRFYDGDSSDLEDILNKKREKITGLSNYDPREDSMFFTKKSDKIHVPFEYTDDMLEYDRHSMMWDEMEDEDIDHFIDYYNIPDGRKEIKGEIIYRPWDELSDETQEKFREYIKKMY